MASLGRVVVGYRRGDRRIQQILDQELSVRETSRCAGGCGYAVYFAPSGYDAAWDRDAVVFCDDCYQRDKKEIEEAL